MVGFLDVMHDVDSCLEISIGQAVTDAGWTNTWTTQTMAKNNWWLIEENPDLKSMIDGLPNDAVKVGEWIQKYCSLTPNPDAGGAPAYAWSSALVLYLQAKIATYYNNADWGAVLGAAGSFASIVSSAMTQDTTTGETEGKNMQSQLQTDNSALQPISDFGSAWAQFLGALANVLSQVGPGG